MIYAVIIAAGVVLAYRLGLSDGMRAAQGRGPAAFALPAKPPPKAGMPTRSERILANVEAYDGTGANQRRID